MSIRTANNRVDRTCRFIQIAVENLLISLVHLRLISIVATPDQQPKAQLCSGRAKGKLGDFVGGPFRQIYTANLRPKRENYIFLCTYIFATDLVPLVLEVVTLCR